MNCIEKFSNEISEIKEKIVDLEASINYIYKNEKNKDSIYIENEKNKLDNFLIEKEMLLLKEKISLHVVVPSINNEENEEMTYYELEARINILHHNYNFYKNILTYTCYDEKMLQFTNILYDRLKLLLNLKKNILNNNNLINSISDDNIESTTINRNKMLL